MKIYSNVITREDIFRTLNEAIPAAHCDEFREFTPRRKEARGFDLYLEALDGGRGTSHPRARNGRPGYALTWDEYGEWFALLFDIDPDAWISGWDGQARFHAGTRCKFVAS